jgi:ZIP family zinc transporter
MLQALLAAAVTGLLTGVGAFPFFFVRKLPRRAYDCILGLGAGLMLAAATLGLLHEALEGVNGPNGLQIGQLALVTAGFLAGVLVASVMDRLIPHSHARGHKDHLAQGHEHEHEHEHETPGVEVRQSYAIVGALSIHRIPEGLAIGAGFAAEHGNRLGWLLVAAVGIQNICEGVVMGAPLRVSGVHPLRGLIVVAASGLAVPLGTLLGQALSSWALSILPFILALAAGILIYVTSNEIIPESHSHGHEGAASTGLVMGFLLTMIIGAVLR